MGFICDTDHMAKPEFSLFALSVSVIYSIIMPNIFNQEVHYGPQKRPDQSNPGSALWPGQSPGGRLSGEKETQVGKRIARRAAGKATGRLLGKLFK